MNDKLEFLIAFIIGWSLVELVKWTCKMALEQKVMSNPLNEFRKIFVAIHNSECVCGMYSQAGDGADFYVVGSRNPNFGHLETCHVIISARVLGRKVVKK